MRVVNSIAALRGNGKDFRFSRRGMLQSENCFGCEDTGIDCTSREIIFLIGPISGMAVPPYLAKYGQISGIKLNRWGGRDARQKAKKAKNHKVELI